MQAARPQPPILSVRCGASRRPAGGIQRWPAAGAGRAGRPQARASAGRMAAGWHGVGGRGRWKRPFDFPIPQVFTASLQLFYSAFMTACCTPGILLIACRKGHCRGARLPRIQTPPPMQIYECADSMILRHSSRSSQGSPAPGLPRYRRTEAEIHLTRLCHRTGYACTPEGGRYE